jgi:hypothetical protein
MAAMISKEPAAEVAEALAPAALLVARATTAWPVPAELGPRVRPLCSAVAAPAVQEGTHYAALVEMEEVLS